MTLILQIFGTAALVYTGSFAACVVWIVLSGRREQRRAREEKAAAIRGRAARRYSNVLLEQIGGDPCRN